jgi:alkaline phosphatase
MSGMSVRASARRRGIALSFAVLVLLALSSASFAATKAKYVFLMIGDGMALPQRNAAEIFLAAGRDATKPGIVRLAMNELPAQGMCTTYSTNSLITDSAAAATAFACGEKTKSGVIAMDPNGERKLPIITQLAKASGRKIGIVSSVSIDHATPAAFYSHAAGRSVYYEIALQLASSGFDYFAGGGLKKPKGDKGDQPDAFEAIEKAGYVITRTRDDFLKLNASSGKILAINPVLDRDKALSYEVDRKDGEITLAEFTTKGIELLDNPNGFFMMVEGGKIDWACHANDAVASIRDTVAFDDAVRVALDFCKKHPDETLVVVLGDHETGGMSIGFAGTQYDTFFSKLRFQKGSYIAFDAFLDGYKKTHSPETAKFDDIAATVTEFFGFRFLPDEKIVDLESKAKGGDRAAAQELELAVKPREMKDIRAAFAQTMKGAKERSSDEETYLLYGEYEPLTICLTHILNRKAGIGWTTYAHTGVPVPVSAIGVGQETFNGYYDNTDVHAKMKAAMGL